MHLILLPYSFASKIPYSGVLVASSLELFIFLYQYFVGWLHLSGWYFLQTYHVSLVDLPLLCDGTSFLFRLFLHSYFVLSVHVGLLLECDGLRMIWFPEARHVLVLWPLSCTTKGAEVWTFFPDTLSNFLPFNKKFNDISDLKQCTPFIVIYISCKFLVYMFDTLLINSHILCTLLSVFPVKFLKDIISFRALSLMFYNSSLIF